MQRRERIKELYFIIFAKDGSRNLCGRTPCQEMITLLEQEFPGVDFGNNNTGFMNPENVLKYAGKIAKS